MEDFSLLIVVSDGALIAYNLTSLSARDNRYGPAPQKIAGGRVGHFKVWRYRERTLVLYSRIDGMNTNFKLVEPIVV